MSIILTVFALVFLGELISWIGQSVLLELAYSLYLRIFYPTLASKQKALKSEILTTKAELMKTSAQDQFAKWAKLRRSVDKGLADLEKISMFLEILGSVYNAKLR
ncbi:GET complex subunit get1 [Marasmius sp. AFHP31]|nr:GET complex subunit get1 [Marasmius sp. AFHP31]